MMPEAQAAYKERDERIGGMKDEDIDIFYSVLYANPMHLTICVYYIRKIRIMRSIQLA